MNRVLGILLALSALKSFGAADSKSAGQMIHRFHNPAGTAEVAYRSEPFKAGLWGISWSFYPVAKEQSNSRLILLRNNALLVDGKFFLDDVSAIIEPKSAASTECESRRKIRFLVLQHLSATMFPSEIQEMSDICKVEDYYKEVESSTLIIDLLAAHRHCQEHELCKKGIGAAPKPYSNSASLFQQRK